MSIGLVSRVNQQELGKNATPLLNVWIYFNLVANVILLPILVLTFMLSKKVTKRHPSLINVCMTWILSGVFSLLLFFDGRANPTDPDPSSALCITQTSLLYGILPMWSVAVLVFMYFILGIVNTEGRASNFCKGRLLLMLGAPYITQLCFSIAALVISLKHPNYVTREHRFFYCALEYHPLSDAMCIFTFIVCLVIVMIKLRLCLLLYRNYRGLRRAGDSIYIDLHFLVRVIVFGLFIFAGMFSDVLSMFSQRNIGPDLYVATAGAVVFIVFGSQADVLRVWCFWRKDGPVQITPASSCESGWANLDSISESEKFEQTVAELPAPILEHGHDDTLSVSFSEHIHSGL